jgi:hypothetical protein
MTALAMERDTPTSNYDYPISLPMATAVKVWNGGITSVNSSGYAIPAADTAGTIVRGRANATVDNAGANGALSVEVLVGICEYKNPAGANQLTAADRGKLAYVVDDQTLARKTGTIYGISAGIVIAVDVTLETVTVDHRLTLAGSGPQATPDATATAAGPVLGPAAAAQLEVIPFLLPNAATTTYAYTMPFKAEIIRIDVIKDVAGAGNTLQAKNGAGTAISDAIAAAVDKAVTSAGTLDKTTRLLLAGAELQLTNTLAAGSTALAAFVYVIRRP